MRRSAVVASLAAALLAGCGGGGSRTITAAPAPAPGHPPPSVGARSDSDAVKGTPAPTAGQCGVERWAVKTLSDPAAGSVNPKPVDVTIADLIAAKAPVQPTDRVPGVETTTYRLSNVHLSAFKQEADSDIHLAIDDRAGHTMIAEIPAVACLHGAAQTVVAAVGEARSHFIATYGQPSDRYQPVDATISLVGVGFFDRIHGQRGVAPNGVELHPVLADP